MSAIIMIRNKEYMNQKSKTNHRISQSQIKIVSTKTKRDRKLGWNSKIIRIFMIMICSSSIARNLGNQE